MLARMTATLRLYTDFVCPFCFIAEESTVPRLLREHDLTLDWCGFELHPSTPPGGRPLSSLFPGADLAAIHRQTKGFAARFDVRDFEPPNTLRNSRRALALAELARERGRLAPYRQAVFQAHWREGKNIEDLDVLQALGVAAGLDAAEARSAPDGADWLRRVDVRQQDARAAGVRGIPTFVFATEGGGRETVVGCQSYDVLAQAARRAGARPQPG
jgi:predicted DsbA family dithiol-disulfide isomerase